MPSLHDFEIVEETDDGVWMRATYKPLGIPIDTDMDRTVVEFDEHFVVTSEGSGMTAEIYDTITETGSEPQISYRAAFNLWNSLLDRLVEPVAISYDDRPLWTTSRTPRSSSRPRSPPR